MLEFLHPILFYFPPEFAHRLAALYLKVKQWWNFTFCRRKLPSAVAFKVRENSSLRLKSRLGLAAGFDKNAELYAALFQYGFGFIEVGTVTPKPQKGNPSPRLWRTEGFSLVNHMGFNSVGLARFRQNILRYKEKLQGVCLLANIGKNRTTPNDLALQDYTLCFQGIEDCVDGFVVNLSSPNTPGLVNLQSLEFLEALGRALPKGKTVFVKLSPDLTNKELTEIGQFISKDERYSGIVVTNTSRVLAERITGKKVGGLSGPPLFERSVECIQLIRDSLPNKTVIGVGGVSSVQDAKRMRQAGADLVEIYTSFIYQGPRLVRELSDFLTLTQ